MPNNLFTLDFGNIFREVYADKVKDLIPVGSIFMKTISWTSVSARYPNPHCKCPIMETECYCGAKDA